MDSVSEILMKLRWKLNAKNDKELAEKLNMPYKTLVGWKTRKSIPIHRLKGICDIHNLNFEVIWGKDGQLDIDLLKSSRQNNNNANSVIVNGSNNGNIINAYQTEVNSELMEFIELFKEYGNTKLLKKFKDELLKIKEIMG